MLLLSRRDERGRRLRVAGRTGPLTLTARRGLGAMLTATHGVHPWPEQIPSSRFGHLPPQPVDYTPAEPDIVVEVEDDVWFEQDRVPARHSVASVAARPRAGRRHNLTPPGACQQSRTGSEGGAVFGVCSMATAPTSGRAGVKATARGLRWFAARQRRAWRCCHSPSGARLSPRGRGRGLETSWSPGCGVGMRSVYGQDHAEHGSRRLRRLLRQHPFLRGPAGRPSSISWPGRVFPATPLHICRLGRLGSNDPVPINFGNPGCPAMVRYGSGNGTSCRREPTPAGYVAHRRKRHRVFPCDPVRRGDRRRGAR